MDYEQCKALKDAGFPQNVWDIGLYTLAYCNLDDCCNNELHLLHHDNDEGGNTGNDYSHREQDTVQDWLRCPTLFELIEACGEKITAIYSPWDIAGDGTTWVAFTQGAKTAGKGATPEVAVALLWISLNKNSSLKGT